MPRIGVTHLKTHASEVLRDVEDNRARYVITNRYGPVGIIVPYASPRQARPESRDQAWAEFFAAGEQVRAAWNSPLTAVEILRETTCPERRRRLVRGNGAPLRRDARHARRRTPSKTSGRHHSPLSKRGPRRLSSDEAPMSLLLRAMFNQPPSKDRCPRTSPPLTMDGKTNEEVQCGHLTHYLLLRSPSCLALVFAN
jgi:prevent-host-death family protein